MELDKSRRFSYWLAGLQGDIGGIEQFNYRRQQ